MALSASLGLAIFACASQSSFRPPPNSVYSSSKEVCQINPALLCQNTHWSKGWAMVHDLLEHDTTRYWFYTQIHGPHHKLLVQVDCEVDTETKAVQHAAVVSQPPLTDKDIDYLRKTGLCEAP